MLKQAEQAEYKGTAEEVLLELQSGLRDAKEKRHQSNVMHLEASKTIRAIERKIAVLKGGGS